MRLVDHTLKILGLSEAMRRWQGLVRDMDTKRREAVGRYAEEIAATLGRVAHAFEAIERNGEDRAARRAAIRDLGRLNGYIETLIATLEGRVDGRRLAGIKRRLEGLAAESAITASVASADAVRIERLLAAEGYFRALADGLRA